MRRLFRGGAYSRTVLIRRRRLFRGGTYLVFGLFGAALIRRRRLFKDGAYSEVALIQGRRLFGGGFKPFICEMRLREYKSTLIDKGLNYFISVKLLILETIVSQRP